ncbi:MAG: RES domain-containing protein [Gemmatimonadales bacterium]|nr:MAG: RES domain-containing protein [Gemmatimonadales bacterium]
MSGLKAGSRLFRIHRSDLPALHFGSTTEVNRRQRWYAPDGSYGVCFLAQDAHVAFAETLLRDLSLDVVQEAEIAARSLALINVTRPIQLAALHGSALRAHGADASVVHGPYEVTWDWSRAVHEHPSEVDGICYRARHDDSGLSVALFERASCKVEVLQSTNLLDGILSREVAEWLERYGLGLTS